MPDDTKDREREQERRVYVVIQNEEPGITSQTAVSDLLLQAEIIRRNRST